MYVTSLRFHPLLSCLCRQILMHISVAYWICIERLTRRFQVGNQKAIFCIVIHFKSWFSHQYCVFFCHFQVKHMPGFYISKKYKSWGLFVKLFSKVWRTLNPVDICFRQNTANFIKEIFQHYINIITRMCRPRMYMWCCIVSFLIHI